MQTTKIKILGLAGLFLMAAALLASCFIMWNQRHQDDQIKPSLSSTQATESPEVGSGQSAGSNSIPLNQAGLTPNTNSGLSVSSSNAASSIKQLDGSWGRTEGDSAAGSGSGSSSSTSAINPATFGEYEKYKDGTTALFGEVQAGTGTELTANHKAAVYYRGWLTSGQLFDESRPGSDGKLQPFVFTIGVHQVIAGWEQALNGMKVGGTRLVIVPPAVGYGAAGQGSIPPNAVLVFQVQLAAVE